MTSVTILPYRPTETYNISDDLVVSIGDCSSKWNEYFSFDFHSNNEPDYEIYMSRDKLRGLAVFILNYLENN